MMKTSNKVLIIAIVIILGLVAVFVLTTKALVGNVAKKVDPGPQAAKTYDFSDFSEVSISGAWKVEIVQSSTYAVEVHAPENTMNMVSVAKNGGKLAISLEKITNLGFTRMSATIHLPSLKSLEAYGGSKITFSGFNEETLNIKIEGASDVEGEKNTIQNLFLKGAGASKVDLKESPVTNADVRVEGAGSVELNMAGGDLTGSLSGAVSLKYSGSVKSQRVETAGAVSVKQKD